MIWATTRPGVHVGVLLAVISVSRAEARAQSLEAAGLVEGSVRWSTNDAQRPERFNYEIERAVYAAGAAIFIAPRIAVGGEWVRLGTVIAPGGTPRNQIEEEQREHALLATVRLRALRGSGAALDIVGGAGALFQSRTTTFHSSGAANRSVNATSPAFSLRLELPIRLADHVAIAPGAAVYFLRRTDITDSLLNLSRTQASTRGAFGANAMVVW